MAQFFVRMPAVKERPHVFHTNILACFTKSRRAGVNFSRDVLQYFHMGLFSRKISVSTDVAKVRELLTRGVERVFPSADFVEKRLLSGERLRIYLGIDPTGPSLHLGHIIPLLKLAQIQKLGHEVVLLIGDFTATIGDPTDKMAARVLLSEEQVLKNAKQYKKQASSVLAFGGNNPAKLKYNSAWLKKLSMRETAKLLSHITYAQTIKRDMFQRRIAEGKDLYVSEFLYPVLQGYDSVAMDIDGEVGGNDQTFNMLMGRDLLKRMKNKEKFVIAMKLLVDPTGKKMGKTEGNMVMLADSARDMFGKVMSWSDTMMLIGFELCTTVVPMVEIAKMKKALEGGTNPKEIKLKLAEAVVALLYSEGEAKKARTGFDAAFTEGKPEDFVKISLGGKEMAEALVEKKVIASKSELRRLIGEGAVTNLDSKAKMSEEFLKTAPAGKYRIGKHRFLELK